MSFARDSLFYGYLPEKRFIIRQAKPLEKKIMPRLFEGF